MEMQIETMIKVINEGFTTKKEMATELGIKETELTKLFKESGYKWSRTDKRYIIDENEVNEEKYFNTKSNVENKVKNNKGIDEKMDIENNLGNKSENNLSMESLLDSIGAKEKKFKPVTVHLREDIVEVIDKLVNEKGNGKGAKQELINGMLELVLKANNYL